VEEMVNEKDEAPDFHDILNLVKEMDGTRDCKRATCGQHARGLLS